MKPEKQRLLFLTHALPYPPVSGGTIKSWKLVEFLSGRYDLGLVVLLKEGDERHEKTFLEKVPLHDYFSKSVHKGRHVFNLVKSYLAGKPLAIYRNYDAGVAAKVKEWIHGYDLVFVDHYEMFQYIPPGYRGRVILHEHNAECILWQRFADTATAWIKRLVLSLEAKRIRKTEIRYCRSADLVLAAPNDIEQLCRQGVAREKFSITYHLGHDEMLEWPEIDFGKTEKALLYVGSLWWEANIDGLVWFLEEVWPLLVKDEPDLKFYIVGKDPDKRIVSAVHKDNRIILTGFVPNLETCFQKCRLAVVPLRFGSGMKVKVLDFLYRGMPVVTSEVGVESIETENGRDIMVCKDAQEWCAAIRDLVAHPEKCADMGRAGRELAGGKYRWEEHLEEIGRRIGC